MKIRYLIGLSWLLMTGLSLNGAAPDHGLPFSIVEVPVYHFEELVPQVALRMEYARFDIQNPEEWKRVKYNAEVESIELVFTKYPADSARWLTPYSQLLSDRLDALFALDPSLNNSQLKWKMVLQTRCKTEESAKTCFHGFVIKYKPRLPRTIRQVNTIWDIESIVSGESVPADTSLMSIFSRNRQWKNALVVIDWTGSMYPYGAQVLLWQKQHLNSGTFSHFVFFNDGNHKTTSQKRIGSTGGVYHTHANDLINVIETMSTVMENGWGGDAPENDLEAVLKGTRLLTSYDEVILLADNASGVRDLSLVTRLDKPVRVVLVDVTSQQVHPDYLEIAHKTGGSIHTLKGDFEGLKDLKEGQQIRVNGYRYRLVRGKLESF